jgi:hypothetical protein
MNVVPYNVRVLQSRPIVLIHFKSSKDCVTCGRKYIFGVSSEVPPRETIIFSKDYIHHVYILCRTHHLHKAHWLQGNQYYNNRTYKIEPPKALSDTPAGALPGNSSPLDLQSISYTQTEDTRPVLKTPIPCGGGVEYLHNSPEGRRRRRKGNRVSGCITGLPCS